MTLASVGKSLRLGDHINVSVRIGLPSFASDDPARVASAGGIAGARHGVAEFAVGVLRILFERAVGEPLLVAKLHAAEVQHRILHRARHSLAPAALLAMKQGRQDARYQMDAGAGIADLGAGHHRETVDLTGGRCRAAGALGDVLIDLAVLVRDRGRIP